jgi:tyrosyl-tRNA synthetase
MEFSPSYDLVEELRWRGLLHDAIPGTQELLNREQVTGYVGFDPTADSLHIGNLVPIMLLTHLQRAGHRPIALVGGATGMIGDPSGKSAERNLLDEATLRHNQACIRAQLERFLDFGSGPNGALMTNNYDWFGPFTLLGFMREVGKHISVSYMMAKDSVKNRLETGISFTEFTYQLIQGYDFCHLYAHHGCKLQMGGSDQWGNIVTGTELIRRREGGEAFALVAPLVTKADGGKFGKTEKGNVWLAPERTSPYQFYQFWLNTTDDDAMRYIRIFTLLSRERIEELEREQEAAPHLRALQHALADEVTTRVHSAEELQMAKAASELLFGKGTEEMLRALPEAQLMQVMDGVPTFEVSRALLAEGVALIDLLAVNTSFFASKGEARKMVQAGGVAVNKAKMDRPEALIGTGHLINDRYLLAQKGKKNYCLIRAV